MAALVFCVSAPFPFENMKAMPLNYNATTYMKSGNRNRESKPSAITQPSVTNIVGTRGLTRIGRVFAPEKL